MSEFYAHLECDTSPTDRHLQQTDLGITEVYGNVINKAPVQE